MYYLRYAVWMLILWAQGPKFVLVKLQMLVKCACYSPVGWWLYQELIYYTLLNWILCVHIYSIHIGVILSSHHSRYSMPHDPSEIIGICWFGAQETLLLMLKTAVLLNIFLETMTVFCFQKSLMNKLKRMLFIYFVTNFFTDEFILSWLKS